MEWQLHTRSGMLLRLRGYRRRAILSTIAVAGIGVAAAVSATAAWGIAPGAFAGVAGLLALAALAVAHDRSVRAAVLNVAETADRVSRGDLASRAEVETGDELETLARAFNDMMNKLVEQRAILHGLEAGLLLVAKDRRIVWHNNVAARWFGIGEDGPTHCRGRVCGGGSCDACPTTACFADGGVRAFDIARDDVSGRRHFHVTVSPVRDRDGGVAQVLELVQDVTARRGLELQLRDAERLARVGELAATIAHEIKNPLASIRAAIELTAMDLPRGSRGEQLVPRLLGVVERLDASVRDLLVFVRPLELRHARCRLPDVIDESIALVAAHASVARVRIERSGWGDAPEVEADAGALRQLFANLVLNAGDAMERVAPERAELRIRIAASAGQVSVELADAGSGIAPAARESLFKPFFTTKPGGTGLGLVICRRIVEGHGGKLTLESNGAAGAVARVLIPCGEAR